MLLLTKNYGPLPVYTTSFYFHSMFLHHLLCKPSINMTQACHTIITITVYTVIPPSAHTTQVCLNSSKLCNDSSLRCHFVIATMMNCAWYLTYKISQASQLTPCNRTSATNCARIYNLSLAPTYFHPLLPVDWYVKLTLYYDDVWDSFFTLSFLLNHHSCDTILEIPHKCGSQADRFHLALESHNELMMGPGQEQWNHGCDKCTHILECSHEFSQ